MADIRALEIPNWGMTMEEGAIDSWNIKVGDSFAQGDPIVTVESTKITNDLEAPFDGTLRRIVADSGDVRPVGAIIGVSADPSVPDAEIDAFIEQRLSEDAARFGEAPAATASADAPVASAPAPAAASAPAPTATAPVPPVATPASPAASPFAATVGVPSGAPAQSAAAQEYRIPAALSGSTDADVAATPHARRLADDEGIDLAKVTGTDRYGRVSVEDVRRAVLAAGGSVPEPVRGRGVLLRSSEDDSAVPATPVARRMAKALGVNLHDARATGRAGRVTKSDVEDAARRLHVAVEAEAARVAPEQIAEPAFETIPFTSVRRVIAQRLQASKQNAPHYRVTHEVEVDALLKLRASLNEKLPGVHLSVNDVIVKAVAKALVTVPEVNVQFDEAGQSVLQFRHADIAIAVATDNGLITPIVREADVKSLAEISDATRLLATKAKAGTLTPDEFQGGSFTISNLGMFGVSQFDAIINPPQAAILAVGAAKRRPVFDADGQVVGRSILALTMSSDHRVIDGALAARFLAELAKIIESPELLLA
ncbi:dihydrolipoamide acetyltransferase family protein [Pseudoclavibacter sp. 13-3]|uniref:dihydrolipoamide acetyltransferase family protein n=1 Tax=Pseudoclavibacter sp. 13-3 TaxID=2901228 RepID=UPI001E450F1D|nr:dihydrolipoamide acetyltransferase family protein [Pseudoclavibacter sp. 13-3]MCD7101803.1 2-oxo acid dehydrogenase subunit E2 [Pseudoclavibacter sp. 13-3]